jgi:hypothetical protein
LNRTYTFEREIRGRKGRTILEKASGAGAPREMAALSLPEGLPAEVYGDVLSAIRDAYQAGRDDCSAGLLPGDAGTDLLRSMVYGAATDALRTHLGGWLPPSEIVQHRIALDHWDEASHALAVSIGTEHTFPLGRYDVRLAVEKKGRQ